MCTATYKYKDVDCGLRRPTMSPPTPQPGGTAETHTAANNSPNCQLKLVLNNAVDNNSINSSRRDGAAKSAAGVPRMRTAQGGARAAAAAAGRAWEVYCDGPLLKAVQSAELFPDSKTFVDMPMKQVRACACERKTIERKRTKERLSRDDDRKVTNQFTVQY